MLALSLVLGAAIEDLTDFDALAARKVHATFGTAHHVFRVATRAARLPVFLVGFQYPVEQRKYRKQQEKFRQAGYPPAEVALVCRNAPLRSSRLWRSRRRTQMAVSGCATCKKIGRGERIRTSDSCVPNAVLYQAELHPDCSRVR